MFEKLRELFRNKERDWNTNSNGVRWRYTRCGGIEVDSASLLRSPKVQADIAAMARLFEQQRR